MTTLEMMSARTPVEVNDMAAFLKENTPLQEIVNYTLTHRTRLVRPIISFDASAIALSFVPAADEGESYSYHHLRGEVYDIMARAGCQNGARYIVPSAHVTIARFVLPVGTEQRMDIAESLSARAAAVVEKIEEINRVLELESPGGGEWVVGQEKGLELVNGRSWYGEGERVLLGEGFD